MTRLRIRGRCLTGPATYGGETAGAGSPPVTDDPGQYGTLNQFLTPSNWTDLVALRGVHAYTPNPSPDATATGTSIAELNAAAAAAGAGTEEAPKYISVPAGNVPTKFTFPTAWQIWECPSDTDVDGSHTVFQGGYDFAANGVTLRGGKRTDNYMTQIGTSGGTRYHDITIENHFARPSGGSMGFYFWGVSNRPTFLQCDFQGNRGADPWITFKVYETGEQGGDGLIKRCLLINTDTTNRGTASVIINDHDIAPNQDNNYQGRFDGLKVINCEVYHGPQTGGDGQPLGLEFFRGKDHEIAFNDISGGAMTCSMAACRAVRFHHNRILMGQVTTDDSNTQTYTACEFAGAIGESGEDGYEGLDKVDYPSGSVAAWNDIQHYGASGVTGNIIDGNNTPKFIKIHNNRTSTKLFCIVPNSTAWGWIIRNNEMNSPTVLQQGGGTPSEHGSGPGSTYANNDADGYLTHDAADV